jgi:hypothetical protein
MPAVIDDLERKQIAKRRQQPAEPLASDTIKWLASLPDVLRPRRLPIQFPRIANALASRWDRRQACIECLEDLLIDRRGSRRGFPIDIVTELAALKNHFETVVHPAPQTVWDEVAERRRVG